MIYPEMQYLSTLCSDLNIGEMFINYIHLIGRNLYTKSVKSDGIYTINDLTIIINSCSNQYNEEKKTMK